MNKKELVDALQNQLGSDEYTKSEAEEILVAFINTVKAALEEGEDVRLTGLGVFSTKQYAPRTARNPRTNQPVQVPAKRVVRFKQFKSFELPTE